MAIPENCNLRKKNQGKNLIYAIMDYLYLYLNWQNVLGTHHASAHGGSSDLIVKMLD